MNKKILFALACAISMGVGGVAAKADTLNFSSAPGSDTFTATSITITNPGTATPVSGIFNIFNGGATVFAPTVWNTASGTETLTVTSGANTDIIRVTSFTFSGDDHNLTILGSGTSQINGGSLVGITFSLTTQLAAGTPAGTPTSFSGSVNTIVPLPGALMLFGSGLVGLAALGRRKKKALEAAAA